MRRFVVPAVALLSMGALCTFACGSDDAAAIDDGGSGHDAATVTGGGSSGSANPSADAAPHDFGDAAADAAPGVPQLEGYTLTFDDEFDDVASGKPNPAVWDYDLAVINDEPECYTDARSENVRIEPRTLNGVARNVLVLQARKEDYPCPQVNGQVYNYTSGGIQSRNRQGQLLQDFSFGHYELAAKIPHGKGTWPAFWFLGAGALGGWPNSGEIDWMETVGSVELSGQYATYSTLHRSNDRPWPSSTNGMGQSHSMPAPLSTDFHVWTMDWTPDTLAFAFAIDGVALTTRGMDYQGHTEEHASFNRADIPNSSDDLGWPFGRPQGTQFQMILNLALGEWGGKGNIDDAIFAAGNVEFLIDYVRVYTKNP